MTTPDPLPIFDFMGLFYRDRLPKVSRYDRYEYSDTVIYGSVRGDSSIFYSSIIGDARYDTS